MGRVLKAAFLSVVILVAISYIWISNPLLALILGSISLVPFMRNVFEIKGYLNRSLYLALSAVILLMGTVSATIWILNQQEVLTRTIITIAAGLLMASTFQTAFSSTRKWDEVRVH